MPYYNYIYDISLYRKAGTYKMKFVDLDAYLHTLSPHEHDYINFLMQEFNLSSEQEVLGSFNNIQSQSKNIYIPSDIIHLKLFDCKKNSRFLNVAEHRHDYIEMNYVYSGCITQTVNGRQMVLKQDDLLILDTQVQHSVLMPGKNDIMLAFRFSVDYFTQNFFREFKADNLLGEFLLKSIYESQEYNRLLSFNIKNDPTIKYLLRLLIIEFINQGLEAESLENNYILAIFTLLLRKYERENLNIANTVNKEAFAQRYYKIVTYLEENYKTATLTSMANVFGYSPAYLSILIKRITQQTFSSLLLSIRLKNTLLLLQNTELPITEICHESGFTNINYFYKNFEKRYGNTPRQYRQKKHRT